MAKKPLDESKTISAAEYVKEPDICFTWTNYYVLLRDNSVMGTYSNLILAVNLLAERGWEALSAGGDASQGMFILVRNTTLKRKNDLLPTDENVE